MELEGRKQFSVNHSEAYNAYFIYLLRYNVHMAKNSNFTQLHDCLLVYIPMVPPSRLRWRTFPYHPKIPRCHFPILPSSERKWGPIMISITVDSFCLFLNFIQKESYIFHLIWCLWNFIHIVASINCSVCSFIDKQLGCLQLEYITHKMLMKFLYLFSEEKVFSFLLVSYGRHIYYSNKYL